MLLKKSNLRNRECAQAIILSRSGAIQFDKSQHSVVTDWNKFNQDATRFNDLRSKGLNYLEIDKILRR